MSAEEAGGDEAFEVKAAADVKVRSSKLGR